MESVISQFELDKLTLQLSDELKKRNVFINDINQKLETVCHSF